MMDNDPDKRQRLNLESSSIEQIEKYKIMFLNRVFLLGSMVAFCLGFVRLGLIPRQSSQLVGVADLVISSLVLGLLWFLHRRQKLLPLVASVLLALAFGLIGLVYLYAPFNVFWNTLFFLLLASAYFLKGRRIGRYWLIGIILFIACGHLLPSRVAHYSSFDLVLSCAFLLAMYFVLDTDETLKEEQDQRTQSHEMQRQIDERWRLALLGAGDAAFEWNMHDDMLKYTQRITEILGSTSRALGSRLEDVLPYVHPQDQAQLLAQMQACQQGTKRRLDLEFRMRAKDGWCWLFARAMVTRHDAKGRPLRMSGMLSDVTEGKKIAEALRQSEEHSRNLASMLQLLCDNVPDMIWAKDLQKRYLFANKALCGQLLNARDTEEPLGKTDMFFAQRERARHPDDEQWHTFGAAFQDSDITTLQSGRPLVIEEFGNAKGKPVCLEVHKAPFIDQKGEVIGVVGSARDITDRRQTEETIRRLNNDMSAMLQAIPDLLFDYDIHGTYLDIWTCNPALLYREKELLLGHTADEMLPADAASMVMEAIGEAECNGSSFGKIMSLALPMGTKWFELSVSKKAGSGEGCSRFIMLSRDITERKEAEGQIHHLAYYDILTGLPNRRLLLDRLNQALSQAQRFGRTVAVMFLDLDNFKQVNDQLGHSFGDELLQEVGRRLRQCIRIGDTVSRQGGDEFVIVLAEIGSSIDAEVVAQKVISMLAEPICIGAQTLTISTSIGISLYQAENQADDQVLMREADIAMYAAKKAGGKRFHFFSPPPPGRQT
jgi:diguanylate cyclase (GGDEF)-like protein/PAS domain S-box-containing protein